MCMDNALKRCGAFVAALVLCFALSVPAFAAETVVSGSLRLIGCSFENKWESQNLRTVASGSSASPYFALGDSTRVGWYSVSPYDNSISTSSAGSYGIYLSCYYRSSGGVKQNHAPARSDFSLVYTDISTGSTSAHPVQSVQLFAPSSTYNSLSDGVTISARYVQSVSKPLRDWILYNGSNGAPSWTFDNISGPFDSSVDWVITSVRVVSTTSSAELDALEGMASEIANQSQILSQFYGDIVAVCNEIYSRLGDLQAAQEEANRLFSNVISLLNTTNGKIEAINMAMSTYFELLINQLKQEGIDIRTAIADAEARLEVYLKPMIDYFNELEEQTGESASTLPQHKQDIDGFNNDGFGIDSDGQTGLTAILPIFTAFSFILSVLGIFVGLGVLKIIIKKGLS